jgi:hypothetical protein
MSKRYMKLGQCLLVLQIGLATAFILVSVIIVAVIVAGMIT